MLALINPKIVAELHTLAVSWTAVALDMSATPSAQPPRGRDRKRRAKTK